MKIKEFVIIPSSIDAMGLIHKPGTGPNNRFGFKNADDIAVSANDSTSAGLGGSTSSPKLASRRPGSPITVSARRGTVLEPHVTKNIFQFIESIDAIDQPTKILITDEKYSKRPFYGLSIMPTFLNSFSRSFEFEIKMLSVYLQFLIKENFNLDSRKDYWFESGLYYYLMLKFLKNEYPNKLVLDEILKQPILRFFLKGYQISKVKSDDLFLHFHEFMVRRNLHQEITLPKNELTRYNEQIGIPSQNGLLFNYLI